MRHLIILLAMVITVSGLAQNNHAGDYPWNPDNNNDNFVGVGDLTGLLSVFGNTFGTPPEPCTYDGTPFEELMAGLITETIVLDSLFVDYQLTDVSTFYLPGCPNPVTDTVSYARAGMITSTQNEADRWTIQGYLGGDYHQLQILFDLGDGIYAWYFKNGSLGSYLNDGFFGGSEDTSYTEWYSIPWPDGWFYDESGIHIEFTSNWARDEYVDYMIILPYWHYVE